MSIFDKFRNKKTARQKEEKVVHEDPKPEYESTEESSNETIENTDESTGEIRISVDHIPQEIIFAGTEHTEDAEDTQNHIPQIQSKLTYYGEAALKYEEWKEQASASEQESGTEDTSSAQEEKAAPPDPPPAPDVDASVQVYPSYNRMTGFLYVLPPVGDGKDVDEEMLHAALEANNITFGIDQDLITNIAKDKEYFRIFPAARGTSPVNGVNGRITDHFQRKQEIRLEEDERGVVDHKFLNIFQDIKAGDIICDIIAPTEGTDGMDITGRVLKAEAGKAPAVPKGKNTSVNEEGTALVADVDGDISFRKEVFRVEPQLTISENVDISTGNVNFAGDILVMGDVNKGFQIRAGGDVIIYGMAESADISAGGDIEIKKGMNGSGTGTLSAGGDVVSRFLEQTTVKTLGDVSAETIINCTISSGSSVKALSGKGIIIGGTIAAAQSIEARRIGNLSNIKTILKIGYAVMNEENVEYLTSELSKNEDTLDKISKNVTYLESLPSIPAGKEDLYKTLKDQKKAYEGIVKDLADKLEEAESRIPDSARCRVQSDIIYGITEVSMNYSKVTISDATAKCNVYFTDGDLKIGTF